jgi:hypothetical protein
MSMRSVRWPILLPFCLAAAGCSVALHGHQTMSGAAATATTSAASAGTASTGSARVAASFGAPAPQGAPGGRLGLSGGAAAVLVLGLILVETFNYFTANPAIRSEHAGDHRRSIAETCSCYGYQPHADPTLRPASE